MTHLAHFNQCQEKQTVKMSQICKKCEGAAQPQQRLGQVQSKVTDPHGDTVEGKKWIVSIFENNQKEGHRTAVQRGLL